MLFLLAVLMILPDFASAANFPLEITNIKPAGTGSPAIPSTNRIFRAYPGIEYNIRPAVIGGLYPFKFSLQNAPSGMNMNADSGEISWPNPQTNSGTITLSVTDSENTTVSTTWAINVGIVGFYFVDSTQNINGIGTISSPFNSIANMIAGTGSSHVNDIVYFRGGTHKTVQNGTGGSGQPELQFYDTAPFTWLGYPGENATIDGGNVLRIRTYRVYWDKLSFINFLNNGLCGQAGYDYQTIRRSTFSHLTTNVTANENQGFIYLNRANPHKSYFVIQDNEFSDFTGASAIGSLYDLDKALIENNYIHGDGGPGGSNINAGIAPKHGDWWLTIRGNKVIMDHGIPLGTNMNSPLAESNHVEICFNYFKVNSLDKSYNMGTAHQFNGFGYGNVTPSYPEDILVDGLYYESTFDFYYYRNTVVGDVSFSWLDGNNCSTAGPFRLSNNIIINNNTTNPGNFNVHDFISYGASTSKNSPWNCVTDTDNLKALPSANAVDGSGNLTSSYSQYIGTRGWQTAAISNDVTSPAAPNGLVVQ